MVACVFLMARGFEFFGTQSVLLAEFVECDEIKDEFLEDG
jgi:hypothetical protein